MLTVPRHNLSFGSRAFRISVPKNWNTLPLKVRQKPFKDILFQISLYPIVKEDKLVA